MAFQTNIQALFKVPDRVIRLLGAQQSTTLLGISSATSKRDQALDQANQPTRLQPTKPTPSSVGVRRQCYPPPRPFTPPVDCFDAACLSTYQAPIGLPCEAQHILLAPVRLSLFLFN